MIIWDMAGSFVFWGFHSLYDAVGKVFELSMKNVIGLFCERFEYYTEDEEPA